MVRLDPQVALLATILALASWPARAQSPTPQTVPPVQTQAQQPSTQPQNPQAQPPTSGPLHWRAQGNTVQPVTPTQQQPAQYTAAPPAPTRQVPVQPATPAPATQQNASPAKPATATTTSHRRVSRTAKPQVAEASPAPAPPPTLDQQPPTPPQVQYQNGQLTVDAQNSTLAQVLRAIQTQTGASIDIPGGASNERVATKIGPGQPRDVLNSLLNGSKFDYVILGVTGDPGAVQKVILTPRQAGGTVTAQNNAAPPPQPEADESADSEPEYQNQTPEQPPAPGPFHRPGFPGQPGATPPGATPPDQNANVPGDNSNNGSKSPEQLMQELQQMQQQQQQLQDQLNPANRQQPQ
jgi:hypothetical protein